MNITFLLLSQIELILLVHLKLLCVNLFLTFFPCQYLPIKTNAIFKSILIDCLKNGQILQVAMNIGILAGIHHWLLYFCEHMAVF